MILNLYFTFYLIISSIIGIGDTKVFDKELNKKSKSDIFDNYSDELYKSIANSNINNKLFKSALKGYLKLVKEGEIKNPDLLSIIDFNKSANEKRLFIINLKNKKTLFEEYVAH